MFQIDLEFEKLSAIHHGFSEIARFLNKGSLEYLPRVTKMLSESRGGAIGIEHFLLESRHRSAIDLIVKLEEMQAKKRPLPQTRSERRALIDEALSAASGIGFILLQWTNAISTTAALTKEHHRKIREERITPMIQKYIDNSRKADEPGWVMEITGRKGRTP